MKSNSVPQLLLAALLLLALSPRHAVAQNSDVQAITTAVPFLMISPDSRSGGLGEAGVAITDNSNATHWNLSALAFTDKKFGASMSYTPWLRGLGVPDINLSYLSGHVNLGERAGVVASSIRYFSLGKIEFTDDNAIKYGEFNANEFAVDAGYARKVTDNFSAGVALRFIYSNLAGAQSTPNFETKPGTSVAGDINMLYTKDFTSGQRPMNFRWGLNLSNIGAKISYTNSNNRDFIPANMRLGAALKTHLDDYNSITLTTDLNKLMVPSEGGQSDQTLLDGMFSSFADAPGGFTEELREVNVSAGLEYWYNNLFAARAGVFLEDATKGNRKYVTLGAGVKYNVFALDFAYLAALQQAHPLQNTLRFSLSFAFDPAGNR
jgi:Type IX secretion system protein PorV